MLDRPARLTALALAIVLVAGLMAGCANVDAAAKEAATKYMTAWASQNWEEVLKMSTGDQLAINIQLIPTLKNVKQTSDLKRCEVVDITTSKNGKIAFASVRFIRAINLPDFGSVMDERTVLLSMIKQNNQWMVYRLDTISESTSGLSK